MTPLLCQLGTARAQAGAASNGIFELSDIKSSTNLLSSDPSKRIPQLDFDFAAYVWLSRRLLATYFSSSSRHSKIVS
jgi:hypothetical protein